MRGFRPEGKVLKVLERAKDEFVGRIEIHPKFSFVIPDNKNYHFDVFVYPEKAGGAKTNDKVLVKIQKWHDPRSKNPLGEILAW
jgi:ribonuclease R